MQRNFKGNRAHNRLNNELAAFNCLAAFEPQNSFTLRVISCLCDIWHLDGKRNQANTERQKTKRKKKNVVYMEKIMQQWCRSPSYEMGSYNCAPVAFIILPGHTVHSHTITGCSPSFLISKRSAFAFFSAFISDSSQPPHDDSPTERDK